MFYYQINDDMFHEFVDDRGKRYGPVVGRILFVYIIEYRSNINYFEGIRNTS